MDLDKDQKQLFKFLVDLGWNEQTAFTWTRAHGRCEYCGKNLWESYENYATGQLDHILPQSKYKRYHVDKNNLALSCWVCNNVKSNLDPFPDPTDMVLGNEIQDDQREVLLVAARQIVAEQRVKFSQNYWRIVGFMNDFKLPEK